MHSVVILVHINLAPSLSRLESTSVSYKSVAGWEVANPVVGWPLVTSGDIISNWVTFPPIQTEQLFATTQSPEPCLLKQVAPQEDSGGVWVEETVGCTSLPSLIKFCQDPHLVIAVKLGPSENKTNGALHKPKWNFAKNCWL